MAKRDWNSLLYSLHQDGKSRFKSIDDLADWCFTTDEEGTYKEKLAKLRPDTTYKELGALWGVPWDVARGIRLSEQFNTALAIRRSGIIVDPLKDIELADAIHSKAMMDAQNPEANGMWLVAWEKFKAQQQSVLKPAQVSIKQTNTFEVVIRSDGKVPDMFKADVIDGEFKPAPALEVRNSSTIEVPVIQERDQERDAVYAETS